MAPRFTALFYLGYYIIVLSANTIDHNTKTERCLVHTRYAGLQTHLQWIDRIFLPLKTEHV